MIIIWGTPRGPSDAVLLQIPWEDCIEKCLDEESCVLISNHQCSIFRLGTNVTVEITDSINNLKVGFKRTLKDSLCPIDQYPPLFGELTVKESYESLYTRYNYTITQTTYPNATMLLQFQFIDYFQCDQYSWISKREKYVCLTIRLFDSASCLNKTFAENLCNSDEGLGITGPYDSSEGLQLYSKVFSTTLRNPAASDRSKEAYSGLGIPEKARMDIWVDGVEIDNTKTFITTDNTINGTNGYDLRYMNSGPCLFFSFTNPFYIRNWVCSGDIGDEYCFVGAACRTTPVLSSFH